MAATAYASVVSLMNTMDHIHSHPSLSTCFSSLQFQLLRQNLDFFLDFVENYSDADSNEAEDLVRRIAASALEAEDKIEVGAADLMRSVYTRKSLTFLFVLQRMIEVGAAKLMRRRSKKSTFLVLQRMIEDMNSIKEKVIKVKGETGLFTNSMPPPSSSAVAASPIATRKTKMVGFEGYLVQLLDELTSSHSGRRILPIVGMGGIGICILPSEIWSMPQLRHIEASHCMYLPDPPKASSAIVLNNLQTLEKVENLNFTEELCRRIPNIKCLWIELDFEEGDGATRCFNFHNGVCLNKLETLLISCIGYIGSPIQKLTLPSSLRELTLIGCGLWWSDMAMLASLPHLQILQLRFDAVVGAEWSCVEQKFRCLKHLKIDYCNDLIKWMAESSNFPVLETLELWELFQLEEIPSGIGEIHTLESINLYNCSESVNISAMKILEEQESLGNESLRLRLRIEQYEGEAAMWREKYPLLIPTYPTYPHFYSDRRSSVVYDSIPTAS